MKVPVDTIICGHNLLVLRKWPDACIDSVVTDPPYGLKFMGKRWDHDVPKAVLWREIFRVLKPGGHLLSFFGTRTYHRGVCAIEDAGFEIRDQIGWAYGSGFPKSLDVSKAIDKTVGIWRGKAGKPISSNRSMSAPNYARTEKGYPITPAAKHWSGWGTALKPAWEPIVVARKPLEGTVAANVLKHGTGGINVDGCRVAISGAEKLRGGAKDGSSAPKCHAGWDRPWKHDPKQQQAAKERSNRNQERAEVLGRWPANIIHDGGSEVLACFPQTKSDKQTSKHKRHKQRMGAFGIYGKSSAPTDDPLTETYGDSGSAARFFYCAKTSKKERDAGCENMDTIACGGMQGRHDGTFDGHITLGKNSHPTVKPLALMRWLVRLVTPPDGLVLDPFCGSGSTCIAAMQEDFHYAGIDKDTKSIEIAKARLAYWSSHAE